MRIMEPIFGFSWIQWEYLSRILIFSVKKMEATEKAIQVYVPPNALARGRDIAL